MPRRASPPRLWKRPERRDKAGKITHAAAWIILDGGRQFSTGVKADDLDGANKALAAYIGQKTQRQHGRDRARQRTFPSLTFSISTLMM